MSRWRLAPVRGCLTTSGHAMSACPSSWASTSVGTGNSRRADAPSRCLRRPDYDPRVTTQWQEGEGAPPGSRLESTLAHVWKEALEVDRVGRDDDFFGL